MSPATSCVFAPTPKISAGQSPIFTTIGGIPFAVWWKAIPRPNAFQVCETGSLDSVALRPGHCRAPARPKHSIVAGNRLRHWNRYPTIARRVADVDRNHRDRFEPGHV